MRQSLTSLNKEWTVKEVVEPKSGKVHRLYYYKGKQCKRIVLDSPMARQLAGYVLIEKDLRSALVWLDEIEQLRGVDKLLDKHGARRSIDREKYNIVKGLFVAILTFYGKAFAQCEGRKVKLEKRQISEAFREKHDEIIALRNNFAAHSGAILVERAEIAVALPPKSKRGAPPNIYREMTQPDFKFDQSGEKGFRDLIEHVREIPLRKISELQMKIYKEEVLPKGWDYWNNKKPA